MDRLMQKGMQKGMLHAAYVALGTGDTGLSTRGRI